MSRKIYNRLSLMAVSWLDESTLMVSGSLLDKTQLECEVLRIRGHRTGAE